VNFFQTEAIPAYQKWKVQNRLSRTAIFNLRKLRACIKPARSED